MREDLQNLRYAILAIGLYYLAVHFLFGQFCPMMIVFHFPCPGCGMTRALWMVLSGKWGQAWELQPLVFGWIILGLWFGTRRYLKNRTKPSKWMKGFLVLLLLGMLGLYAWRVVYGFPGKLAV